MNQGLTNEEFEIYQDLLTKANAIQLKAMSTICFNEILKRAGNENR